MSFYKFHIESTSSVISHQFTETTVNITNIPNYIYNHHPKIVYMSNSALFKVIRGL